MWGVKVRVQSGSLLFNPTGVEAKWAVAWETPPALPVLKSAPNIPYFLEILFLKERKLMQKPTTSFHLVLLSSLQDILCHFFVQAKPLIQLSL